MKYPDGLWPKIRDLSQSHSYNIVLYGNKEYYHFVNRVCTTNLSFLPLGMTVKRHPHQSPSLLGPIM